MLQPLITHAKSAALKMTPGYVSTMHGMELMQGDAPRTTALCPFSPSKNTASRKRQHWSPVAMVAGATNSRLLHIQDRASGRSFLIDTGAKVSLTWLLLMITVQLFTLPTLPHWWQPMGQKLKLTTHVTFHLNLAINASKGLSSSLT